MDNLKISIQIMEKEGPVVARATVYLPITDSVGHEEAIVSIGGFQVMHNKFKPGDYNVTVPSIKTAGGNYKKTVFTTPPEKWEELKQLIIKAYLDAVDNPFTPAL